MLEYGRKYFRRSHAIKAHLVRLVGVGAVLISFFLVIFDKPFMAMWPLGEPEVCTHSSNQSDHIVLMHLSVHCSTVAVAFLQNFGM